VNFTVKEMVSETSGLPPPPAPNSDPDDQPPPPPVEFAEASNTMLTYEAAGSCVGYGKSHVALHFKPTVATKFNVRVMQHQPQHVVVILTNVQPPGSSAGRVRSCGWPAAAAAQGARVLHSR
jgi:hypothetical protein